MKNKTLTLIKHKLQWLALLVALLGVSQGVWGTNEISANDSRASGIFVTYTSGGTQYSNMGYRINDTADMWDGGCTPKMSNYKNKDFHDTNFGVVTELKITGGEVNWRLFGCGSGCNDYIEGRFYYKVWKTTDSEPNDYTHAFTVNTWECGNRWNEASDVSSLLENQNIDLLSKCTSSGEYYVKVKMEVQARWSNASFGNTLSCEARARFTFGEISSNYSLGGYINGEEKTYDSNQAYAFVSKGNGEYVLNRSFTVADNYFLIYDESGSCYGVASYTKDNPATLTKGECKEKVGAEGLTPNQNYTITWNANTKQISWSSGCSDPMVIKVYVGNVSWDNVHIYYWGSTQSTNFPGEAMESLGGDWYSTSIPNDVTGFIINNHADGNNQTQDITNFTKCATNCYSVDSTISDGKRTVSSADCSSTFTSVEIANATVCQGSNVTLVKSSEPSDGVTWTFESNNTSVATVSVDGVVTGVKAGTATITATASKSGYENKSATCTITVNAAPTITPSSSEVLNYVPVLFESDVEVIWSRTPDDTNSYLYETTNTTVKFKGGNNESSQYTIKGVSVDGCEGSATVTVNPDSESCN